MGDRYRLVGSVESGSRIDRVEVEPGKALELHDPDAGRIGNVEELDSEQVDKLRRYVVLEQVDENDVPLSEQSVDQPDLNQSSTSTIGATGKTPSTEEVDAMDGKALRAEVERLRGIEGNEGALPEVKGGTSNEDTRTALKAYYAKGGVS